MKYCKTCKLSYQSPLSHCLFCNAPLEVTQNTSDEILEFHYPAFTKQKKKAVMVKKILSFLLLVAILSCLYIDLNDKTKGLSWSLYTTTCFLFGLYQIVLFTGKKKKIKKILYSSYSIIVFLILLAFYGGHPFWAIDFVYPLGLLVINLSLSFYFTVRKRKALYDIAIYILSTSLLGMIPLLLLLFDKLTFTWPSKVCVLYSFAVLFALLFFSTSQTKEELKRRFHI